MIFRKYTQDSLKDASAQRTKKAIRIIEKNGGKAISISKLLFNENDRSFLPEPTTVLSGCLMFQPVFRFQKKAPSCNRVWEFLWPGRYFLSTLRQTPVH